MTKNNQEKTEMFKWLNRQSRQAQKSKIVPEYTSISISV